jgi:two-component sensor histidine kinase
MSTTQSSAPSGLAAIPRLEWGSHLTQFFAAGSELRDVLVPYFKAGLENNERCLWVTGKDFDARQARSALREVVEDFDARESAGQIEVADGDTWYAAGQPLRPAEIVAGLVRREQDAVGAGYAGLRTNGNCAWVGPAQWSSFLQYESLVHQASRTRRMICMCSYCLDQVQGPGGQEVMARHDLVIPARPGPRRTSPPRAVWRDERQFDLAMLASQMGTWRYTLDDNICVYDTNAQRLYGLTEARFLHDSEAVRAKFHGDDVEAMWTCVQKALDPRGDGRYEAEYRVRQLDGSWRWLSASGLVEYEGEGPDRRAVAIVGASRDLSGQKRAEEFQALLLNESNHRIKNTFATLQSIVAQTLRNATDLDAAREALNRRLLALTQAHDLLGAGQWRGADIRSVVARALAPFSDARVSLSGPSIEITSGHALSLSLALHELATNASKYGALSAPAGQVAVTWDREGGRLHLDWRERQGPAVMPPARTGFGSRLLRALVEGDLGGTLTHEFHRSGVQCSIVAAL